MTKTIRLLLVLILLAGCDKPLEQLDPREVQQSLKELEATFNMSKEELQKLKQVDYKVVSIPSTTNDQRVEQFLTELGKERWDCFNVVATGDSFRIFCRRPTHTPLRYVPGSIRNSFGG